MSDDYEDDDILDEDDGEETDATASEPVTRYAGASRAWRSIERYRELRELRKHLEDFMVDELSEASLKDLRL